MKLRCLILFGTLISAFSCVAADKPLSPETETKWHSLTERNLEIRGLPWFDKNAPELWRLPKNAKDKVPGGVWNRALAPDGGRVRMRCGTSRLSVRVQGVQNGGKPCFFDVYVAGEYAGSARLKGNDEQELLLFEKKDRQPNDITIYFPNNHQVRLLAIGVDADAELQKPGAFQLKSPIVCYGSSVLQGTGAAHPAKTYPAALARRLNLDFVNLGFGGAGKAEADVVSLVNELDACCFIFDLGKSYGAQGIEPFARMLETVRAKHPKVPIVCVTPIYSTKENSDPSYEKKSEDLRALMRKAANDRREKGDKFIFVSEGLALFGESDKALFNDPLHPNDDGNERMAERLAPILKKILHLDAAAR